MSVYFSCLWLELSLENIRDADNIYFRTLVTHFAQIFSDILCNSRLPSPPPPGPKSLELEDLDWLALLFFFLIEEDMVRLLVVLYIGWCLEGLHGTV